MDYDDPLDPVDDVPAPEPGGGFFAPAQDEPEPDAADDETPGPAGGFYSDALDSLESVENEPDLDVGSGGIAGLLGEVPSLAPPPPPPPPPPLAPPPPPPSSLFESVASRDDEPAAAPPPSPLPDGTGSGDPTQLPVTDAHCAMCGMTVPIDVARGRCHVGHRQDAS